jgi:hypothetical protein
MRIALFAAVAALAGCAATPQQMAQQSNWDVCRFTMGGPHSQVAEYERQRRGLDCTPYYPSIAAKLQAENAAVANYLRATQPPPAALPPQQVNCTSRNVGGTVQTSCW